MPLLTLANLSCAYGSRVVLDGVTLSIEPGEKIGLLGRNGSGKTTLMRIMLGALDPDAGSRQVRRGATVGYLRQDPAFDPAETVYDAAEGAFERLHRLHRQVREVYDEMSGAAGDRLAQLLKRQATLEAEVEAAGGYAINHRIEASLHGLGFADEQFELETRSLSGGQLSRLGLARLLLEAPDLLLLDEPTNHLDLDGRRWLERFLAEEYRPAVVLVSHDRWLVDRVASRIIEVEGGRLRNYPGNYSRYVEIRGQQRLTAARTYEKQVDKIRREEKYIQRYRAGQRAKQARGRESRLERFRREDLVECPSELDVMRPALPRGPRSGDLVMVAEHISKRYGDTVLFEDVSLSVGRGDRLGVIGPNGVGKTTLVECLLGERDPDRGTVRLGSRVGLGYYRQRPVQLDLSLLVWQYLQSVIVSLEGQARASEQQARDLAGAFLFSGSEQDKPLRDLSGGELSRVVLAGLVAGAHNLLVLDEPTNHLDIPSAERLEQALAPEGGYDGTLILVTHDRALLEATCRKLLVFDGRGHVRLLHGRYSQWLDRAPKRQEQSAAVGPGPGPKKSKRPPAGRRVEPPASEAPAGLSLGAIERRIEAIEQRIDEIDRQLLDPDVYANGARCKTLQAERAAHTDELRPLEAEWARRAEKA
ncbi:MAG: ABC-F family ATP-binding cassette domain-containing protein [Planctomycetota bacterium]|jgi:ATP-binding cassette subfamily F protein 3